MEEGCEWRDGKEMVEKFMSFQAGEHYKDSEVMGEVVRLFDTKYRSTNNTFELLVIVAYKN